MLNGLARALRRELSAALIADHRCAVMLGGELRQPLDLRRGHDWRLLGEDVTTLAQSLSG